MHTKQFIMAGRKLSEAKKVLILLHGRGGSAEDILSLADQLQVSDFALVAPQATNNTWYPYSFMAPAAQNEPWLTSAITVLKDLTDELEQQGIPATNIYFGGFSQGACLTLEFVTRHAKHYGGVVAFTGGLIGETINTNNYGGNLAGTPIFIGTSDPDMHVPVQRVWETEKILQNQGANVTVKVYKDMGHTISQGEISMANKLVFNPAA